MLIGMQDHASFLELEEEIEFSVDDLEPGERSL